MAGAPIPFFLRLFNVREGLKAISPISFALYFGLRFIIDSKMINKKVDPKVLAVMQQRYPGFGLFSRRDFYCKLIPLCRSV